MNEAEGRAAIERWYRAALEAADPFQAVLRNLLRNNHDVQIGGVSLPAPRGVYVAAIGKAAAPMARAAEQALGSLIRGGMSITKDGHAEHVEPSRIGIREASHPIPDQRGVDASRALIEQLNSLDGDDFVLALISGGGSALLEAPRHPLTLEQIATTTNFLLRAGAPIEDLNAVRIPLSAVKGGGLRRAAGRARFATLILSDVLGNDPQIIASGPTVYSRQSGEQALMVLDRYELAEDVPKPVVTLLRNSISADDEDRFAADRLLVIADNDIAVSAAAESARSDGLLPNVTWREMGGDARTRAKEWIELCAESDSKLLLGGGEFTVQVTGDGIGGRNTEFALAAALELERRGMSDWLVGSLATDGQDALTGVAGAIASVETLGRARGAGIDPQAALDSNDSLAVFEVAGGAIATGPTGTNVNDLYFALQLG